MRLSPVRRINNLNMIGFVARHHLIARHTLDDRMHDRPLRRGFAPASFGFFFRKSYYPADSEIAVQSSIHHENPAPDNMPRFRDPLQCSAAKAEIHRRLALA